MGRLQVLEHLSQVRRRDEVRALRRRWREQDPHPGRVVDHHRLDDVRIRLTALDGVEHRAVLGVQVEQNADVAELEIGVDEADAPAGLLHEADGQVGGDRRPPGPALG